MKMRKIASLFGMALMMCSMFVVAGCGSSDNISYDPGLSPEEELIQLREQVASLQEENDNLKNLIQQAKKTARSVIAPYLTEEVLEEMHKNKGQLTIGGERRYVAMLFTDLRDSTAIAEQMQTQDFIRMLQKLEEECGALMKEFFKRKR